MARRIGGLVRLSVIVAFALAGSQLTAFMNAYEQNLAGRLAEAERDVAGIIDRAMAADLPVYAYLEAFHTADNPIFVQEGAALQAKVNRAAFMSDDLGALERAGLILKPVVFFGRFDPAIARDVGRRFVPALPIDGAGLIYTGTALLLGLLAAEAATALGRLAVRTAPRRSRPVATGHG